MHMTLLCRTFLALRKKQIFHIPSASNKRECSCGGCIVYFGSSGASTSCRRCFAVASLRRGKFKAPTELTASAVIWNGTQMVRKRTRHPFGAIVFHPRILPGARFLHICAARSALPEYACSTGALCRHTCVPQSTLPKYSCSGAQNSSLGQLAFPPGPGLATN